MSSKALSAVLDLRGISDRQFRILVALAENEMSDFVHVQPGVIADMAESNADVVIDEMIAIISMAPTAFSLRLKREDISEDSCENGTISGAVYWRRLAQKLGAKK